MEINRVRKQHEACGTFPGFIKLQLQNSFCIVFDLIAKTLFKDSWFFVYL